ncbi:MAG: beta-lactamase family protein [Cyanobacteria bacterium REEB67]|nr:beta-lactamase family protein [Cyanobacteria bacterium REEB67]
MAAPKISLQNQVRPDLDGKQLADFGIDARRLGRLYARIEADIAADLYPGAAVALARRGQVVAEATFGMARLAGADASIAAALPADGDTLWLLYSQTKPVTACAVWILIERGLLNLHIPVTHYLPEFGAHGKGEITLFHLLTHQAGFPNANVPEAAWSDHQLLRTSVCDFTLDFDPGSKVLYHSYSAHWVLAVLIEIVTGKDFRQFIKEEVIEPLALSNLFVGVPDSEHHRLAGSYETLVSGEHVPARDFDNVAFYRSGMPGAGGYATAGDVALFYQMLLHNGEYNGVRLLSPRMVQYATRNHTADRPDEFFGMPTHRALGVHVRGTTASMRGLSSIASPATYGHGGVGTSYSFADPESGVSFTYLTNARMPEPGHSKRLEEIITMAHASICDI